LPDDWRDKVSKGVLNNIDEKKAFNVDAELKPVSPDAGTAVEKAATASEEK